ncbi:unnamed protein product [Vicia faba]|uniref:Uncharacterized protein n=1 Tax=Vicia faba TaxID=3906 RepID=A0AAV0YF92_VICFA|nr:unnamed protein product [Vicia faba]
MLLRWLLQLHGGQLMDCIRCALHSLQFTFTYPPASATAVPLMHINKVPPKTKQGDITLQNLPLQDLKPDPEDSEALQAQHSASKSPVVSSYESEESGDAKLNTSSKVTINLDINRPISENLNSNQTEDRKLVDLSFCGSNTTSGSEETDALEKKKNRSREITSL